VRTKIACCGLLYEGNATSNGPQNEQRRTRMRPCGVIYR
jgi:hypothetical protein